MIERFQDENILLNSKQPEENLLLYDALDIQKMGGGNVVSGLGGPLTQGSLTEVHIYSGDNLVQSNTPTATIRNTSLDKIILRPEDEIRLSNIEKGYYSLVYNFVKPVSPPNLKIERISGDGSELELSTNTVGGFNQLFGTQLLNQSVFASGNTLADNLVLNFGNNNLAVITDISFKNNPIVGEKTVTLNYPSRTVDNKTTTFYPSLQDRDENFWIELFDDTLLTTGTASKYNAATISDGVNAKTVELRAEQNSNGSQKFYTNNKDDIDTFFKVNPNEYKVC